MDHNNFETTMIDFVNRHSKAEEEARNQRIREEQENAGHLRRRKTVNAVIEAIIWLAALVAVVVVMSFAFWMGFIPAEIAILVCTVFSFLVGMSINSLAVRIKRYGGR
jgi:uncharacterized membrane protein (DUF485 family)